MIRNSGIFEALFPGSRRILLTALFAEPQRWWTVEELAGRAAVRPASVQSQLTRLRESGVLREERNGGCSRFQPNSECQVFAELRAMVMKLTSGGGETILIVEDTAATAQITRILLESWGYRAFEAHTPAQALALFDAHSGEIHMVLTDVMMPRMTGPQLADELRRRNPELRIAFMSGNPDPDILDPHEMFLPKPFTPARLAEIVRKALDDVRR